MRSHLRRARVIGVVVALCAAVLAAHAAPAGAVGPRFSFHFFGNGYNLDNMESVDPPGDKPIVGDFVGPATAVGELDDVFWYTPGAGGDGIWRSTGDRGFQQSAVSVSGDYTPLVGYFGNDGAKEDIVWLSKSGTSQLWDFNADGSITKVTLPAFVKGTGIPLVSDFTADGWTDVIVYQAGSGADGWFDFNGDQSVTNRPFSISGTYKPLVGRYGSDLATDILWYAPGSAPDSMWDINTDASITKTGQSINGTYRPVTGSFTNDGVDDIIWYAPGSAPDPIWDYNNASITKATLSINSTFDEVVTCLCHPTAGGTEDILFHNHGNGSEVVWDVTSGGLFTYASRTYTSPNIDGAGIAAIGSFENTGDLRSGIITYDEI